jgi:methyl-accepting chemotaxis protein
MRNSVRIRLTVAFIGLAISPLLLVGIVLAWQSFTTQEQQALNLQREVAQRVSTQVTAFFEGLENELHLTSQVQGLQKLDQDKQHSVLSGLLAYHNVFDELALLDSQGQEQVRLSRTVLVPELRDRSQADEFVAPQTSGKTYYSPVRFDETTGEPLMTIAVPLLDARTGQADGVLVSEVRIKKIWDLIASMQVSPGQSVYVVNAQGQVVAHRNPSVVLGGTSFRAPDQNGIQPGLGGSSVILAVDKVSLGEQEFTIVAEQTVSEALALAYKTILITGGLIVVALVVSSLLGFLMVRQIVQPIQTMAMMAQAISAGDLYQQVKITSQDELGILAKALNSMTAQLQSLIGGLERQNTHLRATVQKYGEHMTEVARGNLAARLVLDGDGQGADDPLFVLGQQLNETTASLQRMIVQIRDAANNLSSAAVEILAAATQQSAGASEQSAAISQTTTTVDEVKAIAEQASAQAQGVADASQRTVQISQAGQRAVRDTIESMEQIKERVEGIAENILALSEQTQQIGEIIATVNDLASQSNILALNASIEAARAGEHGKGFAVVAVEVRNLAEQSKQATTQVKTILSEIQKATNAAVMATEEGTKKVDAGVQLATQTQQAIEQLSGVITESAQAATQMVAGGRQQVSGVEQIALAMRNINQATMQSLTSTRQAEKSAQGLSELARSLAQTVAQYKL